MSGEVSMYFVLLSTIIAIMLFVIGIGWLLAMSAPWRLNRQRLKRDWSRRRKMLYQKFTRSR